MEVLWRDARRITLNRLLFGSCLDTRDQFILLRGVVYQPSVAYTSNSRFVDFRLCSLRLPVRVIPVTIRYSMCSISSKLAKCLKFYSSILTNYLDIYELIPKFKCFCDRIWTGDLRRALNMRFKPIKVYIIKSSCLFRCNFYILDRPLF